VIKNVVDLSLLQLDDAGGAPVLLHCGDDVLHGPDPDGGDRGEAQLVVLAQLPCTLGQTWAVISYVRPLSSFRTGGEVSTMVGPPSPPGVSCFSSLMNTPVGSSGFSQ
jgi:hypothetical protein